MTGSLKNSTIGTFLGAPTASSGGVGGIGNNIGSNGNSGSSTSNYGFPSSSFTPQKQPTMPSDQKAKLLAMHRDGKANAGIYVAVVLFVYFILVILLLCRYAKRRRTTDPPILGGVDATTAEQGRFHLSYSHIRNLITCNKRTNDHHDDEHNNDNDGNPPPRCLARFSMCCCCCCSRKIGGKNANQTTASAEDYEKDLQKSVLMQQNPQIPKIESEQEGQEQENHYQVKNNNKAGEIQGVFNVGDESQKFSVEFKSQQSGTGTTSMDTNEYQQRRNEDFDDEDEEEEEDSMEED